MERNFYVGIVNHNKKRLKPSYQEKIILYKEGNLYIDLLTNNEYTIDKNNTDYVLEETLVPTDITDYKIDYLYLLRKRNNGNIKLAKKRKITWNTK